MSYGLSGNITESSGITNWRVSAHKCATGALAGTATSGEAGTTYSITGIDNQDPCNITISPVIDQKWIANSVIATNKYVIPTAPDTTPKLYKVTTGTSSTSTSLTSNLILDFVGTNNSTTFTDGSVNQRTPTTVSNAIISTAQFKAGSSSGYFAGNSYLMYAQGNSFAMPANFGIRFWVYFLALSGYQIIFDSRNGANGFYFGALNTAVTSAFGGGGTLTTGTWHHIEMDRVSGIINIYLNGTSVYTSGSNTTSFTDPNLYIGRTNEAASNYLNGYLAQYDINCTQAFNTANFTPPTAPLSVLRSGATEPTWPASGTVSNGDLVFTYIADLIDPKSIGPKIPS